MLAPEGALNIHEKAWNAYPYCRTGECVGEDWGLLAFWFLGGRGGGYEGITKEATSREAVPALTLDFCPLSPFCGQEKQNTVLWS